MPERTLREDLLWVVAGGLALAICAHTPLGRPWPGVAPVWWASGGLAAVLATTPRARWRALGLAAFVVFALVGAAFGDAPLAATAQSAAFVLEGATGGRLAVSVLSRGRSAGTPLGFALVLILVALVPPLAGATLDAALAAYVLPGAPRTEGAFAARWLADYSGDSFGALSIFPFALAVRREPLVRVPPRRTAASLLLVAGVVLLTVFAFATLPRPFSFTSLVLGASALVAGPRTVFLLVWACTVAATGGICRRLDAPPGLMTIGWQQLNIFLPIMAISAPIQVLSAALQRLSQANDVLRRSRARFHQLYDRAPVMLQSLDEQGRTIEVNAQWLATLGWPSAESVRGAPLDGFLAPEERRGSGPPWHVRFLTGGGHKLHVRLQRRDGQIIHALASAASTPEDAAAGRGVVLAFEDVSVELAMRAEMERERDQLAALSSATVDLAIFLDRDLRYRSVNRAFERYWGLTRAQVIGRHQSEVIGKELFERDFAGPLARALAGAATTFRSAVDFRVGRRMMEISAAPAFDASGAPAGVVLTLHDVTELVDATRELRLLVEELQHANEGLEQFARIASHDLREPLNTISQFSGLIAQDYEAELAPEAKRWFALMAQASLRMKAMLDDVLQFARLERAPQAPPEAVALDRVFADLALLLHARLTQTRAELVVAPGLPTVLGQASLLELLFQNLLMVAMRAATPSVAPRIAVGAEVEGDTVIVTVEDNGVAIPEDELERVFAPFHRLQAWRPNEDSGLGLAISRRIATALGGRIWAESGDGGGGRFRVALRAAPLAETRAAA